MPETTATTTTETIPWWIKSKTVIAAVVGIVFSLLTAIGVNLYGVDSTQVADAINGVIAAIAGLFAIYGRFAAAKKEAAAIAAAKK